MTPRADSQAGESVLGTGGFRGQSDTKEYGPTRLLRQRDEGNTPLLHLCHACANCSDDGEMVRTLVGAGASVDAANKQGMTALQLLRDGYYDSQTAEALVAAGAPAEPVRENTRPEDGKGR